MEARREFKTNNVTNNKYNQIYNAYHKHINAGPQEPKKGFFGGDNEDPEIKANLEQFNFNSELMTRDKHVISLNPNFFQSVTMDIEINDDDLVPPSTLIILLKHQKYDKRGQKTDSVLLGRYWMSLNTTPNSTLKDYFDGTTERLDFIFQKPTWIPMIYDRKEQIDGRILMSYSLIEMDDFNQTIRNDYRSGVYNNKQLFCGAINNGYIRSFRDE